MSIRSDLDEECRLAAVAADRATAEAAFETLRVAASSAEARVREARAAESGAVKAVAARLQLSFSKQQQEEDADEAAEVANHDRIICDTKRRRSAAAAERLMRQREQAKVYESRKAALLARATPSSSAALDSFQPAVVMAQGILDPDTPATLPSPTTAPAACPAAQSSGAGVQDDVKAAERAALDLPPREHRLWEDQRSRSTSPGSLPHICCSGHACHSSSRRPSPSGISQIPLSPSASRSASGSTTCAHGRGSRPFPPSLPSGGCRCASSREVSAAGCSGAAAGTAPAAAAAPVDRYK